MFRFLTYCLLFLIAADLQAQWPEYKQITDRDGLPCNEIYDLHQDKNGYIWLGTDIGIFRYDGYQFKAYNAGIISGRPLTGIKEVGDAIYCYSFNGHILKVQGDSLVELPNIEKILPEGYASLVSHQGELIVGTQLGLFKYLPEKQDWEELPEYKQIPQSGAFRGLQSSEKHLWAMNGLGIHRLKPGPVKTYAFQAGLSKGRSQFDLQFRDNNGLLAAIQMDNGEFFLENPETQELEHYQNAKLDSLVKGKKFTNLRYTHGEYYLLTFDGLIRLNVETDLVEYIYQGIPCTDVIEDPSGLIWISTLGYGILQIPHLDFLSFKGIDKEASSQKITRIERGDGGVYYSRLSGEFGHIPFSTQKPMTIESPNQVDITCLRSSGGKIIVALNNILYELRDQKLVFLQDSIPPVKDYLITPEGAYMASSAGLYHLSQALGTIQESNRIYNYWHRCLEYDAQNRNLWSGSNHGLFLFHEQRAIDSFFLEKRIQNITWHPASQSLYTVVEGSKVYRIKNRKVELLYSFEDIGIQAYSLIRNGHELIIATSRGLAILNLMNEQIRWFRNVHGLTSNIIYDMELDGKRLWLATGEGVQVIPVSPEHLNYTPSIYLNNIIGPDGEPLDSSKLIVKFDQELRFHFDVLSYHSAGKFFLEYKVDEEDWIRQEVGSPLLVINQLNPGKRQIQVRAVDTENNNSKIISFMIEVKPLYWQTTGFFVLLVLTTATIAGLAFIVFLRNVKRRQQNQLEKARIKTDLIESQLKAVKAQMNPHFIFNSLNSIYELIMSSEADEAATYLGKFSSLLRQVLENSEKQSTSLKEECDWMELYLQLEKLRFGDEFHYTIVPKGIEHPELIHLPTMLLQPFIENAIKHGLLHKEGFKQLVLEFEMEANQQLVCRIQDNGVGRKEADRLRAQRNPEHKSFATGAILRRIDLINASERFTIGLQIKDLEADSDKMGTLVELRIKEY